MEPNGMLSNSFWGGEAWDLGVIVMDAEVEACRRGWRGFVGRDRRTYPESGLPDSRDSGIAPEHQRPGQQPQPN